MQLRDVQQKTAFTIMQQSLHLPSRYAPTPNTWPALPAPGQLTLRQQPDDSSDDSADDSSVCSANIYDDDNTDSVIGVMTMGELDDSTSSGPALIYADFTGLFFFLFRDASGEG